MVKSFSELMLVTLLVVMMLFSVVACSVTPPKGSAESSKTSESQMLNSDCSNFEKT